MCVCVCCVVCVFLCVVPPNIAGEGAPQDVAVLRGRQVTLECQSDAVPPPTLTWLKDGSPLQVNQDPAPPEERSPCRLGALGQG